MDEHIVIYEPDNALKEGFLAIFNQIFKELYQNRWLTYQLFRRDFISYYKQSCLGIIWAIIFPIVSIAIFIGLNRSGILNIGDIGVPYSIYALIGLSFWQFFSNGLVACSNALVNAGPMILKINFSKKSLVIASLGKTIVPFLIQLIVIFLLFIGYRISPTIWIISIPLLIIPLLLLTLGLGFFTSLINGVIRDMGNIISILMMFLMFFTPVLYAKPKSGFLATITEYNPLYYLVSVPRELILGGSAQDFQGFFLVSIISLILFILCLFGFHLTETRVTERI